MSIIVKTKYKMARRLGSPIFEKTQTQKYALSESRKKGKRGKRPSFQKSEFAKQHNEKQKTRYTYFITEKQFANYIKEALADKENSVTMLFALLERRLDNAVFRAGFATTRPAARQMVTHGHITVNSRKVDVPSFRLSEGDIIAIRGGSAGKAIFANLTEKMNEHKLPAWLSLDVKKMTVTVTGTPHAEKGELMFDLGAVLEFYSR